MRISACMIVKNESKNIARCINSYKDIVDEIIVVDTGSTDNTVEIAEELGAKVLFRAWDNDFAAAKNFALDHATGDWIITLDADEYFEDGSALKLKEALLKIDKNRNIEAVQSRIYNIDQNNNRFLGSMPTIRVIRNNPEIRFIGKIHEAPKRAGEFLKNENVQDIKIYHTGYSLEWVETKWERNLKMLKEEEKTGEADSFIYYYITETYYHMKKYEEANTYADIFMSKPDFNTLVKIFPQAFRIYIYKSVSMSSMESFYTEDDIYAIILEGIKQFPFHPELIKNEADFLLNRGKLEKAMAKYKETIRLNNQYHHFYNNNVDGVKDKVLYVIGEIYSVKGCFKQAFDYFIKSLEVNKYNGKAFNSIVNLLNDRSPAEKISFLNHIYDINAFKDIEFLSIHLAKQKDAMPFLYYFIKKWKWKYDDYGTLLVIALLLKGDSKKALQTAFPLLVKEKNDENELYTVISLIYGNNSDWYQNNKKHLSSRYKKILNIYFDEVDSLFFTEEEMQCYQNILKELFSFENKQYFQKFLQKTQGLMIQSFEIIGDILKDNQHYELAIDHYKNALEQDHSMNIKQKIRNKIGFCYYHMKLYKESTDFYEQVLLDEGDKNYEPIQFLEWISQKDINHALKNRITNLIAEHSTI